MNTRRHESETRTVRSRTAIDSVPVYSSAPASDVPVRFRASSNESARAPSAALVSAVADAARRGNIYPTMRANDLIEAIADRLAIPSSRVAVGDGSLSLLNYVFLTYLTPGQSVVHAWRSYEAYPICVLAAGGIPRAVPLADDHRHDLIGMLRAIDSDTGAVILCSPNNPTGTAITKSELTEFLESTPRDVLVVFDEAYHDFVPPEELVDSLELIDRFPNLLVLRTFSKAYGLAGFRVGFAAAQESIIEKIRRIQPPFPVASGGIAAALVAIQEESERHSLVAETIRQRELVTRALRSAGLPVVESRGNFVWLPVGEAADSLSRRWRESGISVRSFANEGVRVTVGLPGLPEALLESLQGAPRENDDRATRTPS